MRGDGVTAGGTAGDPVQHGASREPLYGMAVASQLTGVNPPMLRAYEARGLIQPWRSSGGTRRYSDRDVACVRRITVLLEAGLNLAGVAEVLRLEAETRALRSEVHRLQQHGSTYELPT